MIDKLNKREVSALKDISHYTRTPTKIRHGYSKYWTPKTNVSLEAKGLVVFMFDSIVITDSGIKKLNEQ